MRLVFNNWGIEFKMLSKCNLMVNYFHQYEWHYYNNGYQALKNEIEQSAYQIENETTIEPFLYLAQLVPSLIAYHEGDIAHFDSLKLDFLEEIILACDTIAGEATYIAAYLYESVTGQDISGYMDCQQNPLPRSIKSYPDIKIYPNPAMDRLSIEGIDGNVQIGFYSITGQLIKKLIISNNQVIDISDFHQGVFILKVSGESFKSEQSFKLIKM